MLAPAPSSILATLPGLATWRANLDYPRTPGAHLYTIPAASQPDAADHYDATLCFYHAEDHQARYGLSAPGADASAAEAAAVAAWSPQIAAAVVRLRDQYVLLPQVTALPEYRVFPEGLARHWRETGDPLSLEAVKKLSPKQIKSRLEIHYQDLNLIREVALALGAALVTQSCGLGDHPLLDSLAALSLGHLDRWTMPEPRAYGIATKPFMLGLAMRSLIAYREAYLGLQLSLSPTRAALVARVPDAVNRTLDRLWATCWYAPGSFKIGNDTWPGGAFAYQDLHSDNPLLAPITGLKVGSVRGNRYFSIADPPAVPDGHYRLASMRFDDRPTTPAGTTFNSYLITGHRATGEIELTATFPPTFTPVTGERISIRVNINPTDHNWPSPDLNHLVAPAYAWAELQERRANGDTPRAKELRERFAATFAGGTTAVTKPSGQKQWNQSMFWTGDGIEWYAEAGAMIAPEPEPEPDPPVDPPLEPGLLPKARGFIFTAAKAGRFRVTVARDGDATGRWLTTPPPPEQTSEQT